MSRENAREVLGFSSDIPVIAVIGGSQGSRAINDAFIEALPLLRENQNAQIFWQTGLPGNPGPCRPSPIEPIRLNVFGLCFHGIRNFRRFVTIG